MKITLKHIQEQIDKLPKLELIDLIQEYGEQQYIIGKSWALSQIIKECKLHQDDIEI